MERYYLWYLFCHTHTHTQIQNMILSIWMLVSMKKILYPFSLCCKHQAILLNLPFLVQWRGFGNPSFQATIVLISYLMVHRIQCWTHHKTTVSYSRTTVVSPVFIKYLTVVFLYCIQVSLWIVFSSQDFLIVH